MMNYSYVIFRINQWAEWRIHRNDGGTGFPKKVPYADLMPKSQSTHYPEMSEECLDLEKCVMAVKAVNAELYAVLMMAYTEPNMTVEQKFKRIGCCKQTFYTRIGQVHKMVSEYLIDLSIGMTLPSPEINLIIMQKSA